VSVEAHHHGNTLTAARSTALLCRPGLWRL
jgi:hypothetical protein